MLSLSERPIMSVLFAFTQKMHNNMLLCQFLYNIFKVGVQFFFAQNNIWWYFNWSTSWIVSENIALISDNI